MCGIAGIISVNPNEISTQRLKSMTDAIAHRGPDGDGHWISANGKVGLGHRRLSIIDLSHEADQPMHYLDRYSLVFNGEIYNYLELKETLVKQGYQFHTQSDTEVLIALFDKHREHCLSLLDGMFAFVLYDQVENMAFIVRDRFGEKPFFYSFKEGQYFLFGSEMKALWAGGIKKEVSNRMLFNYLSLGYIENPEDLSETFYEQCTRLEHGHYLMLNIETLTMVQHKYYDINWKQIDYSITLEKAKEKFQSLFYTSVQRRLRSDVTVGSSLSGGLDSSLVVCVIDELKKASSQKQNTFSAVFPGYKKDERRYMDYVIAKTSVEPHFVTPDDNGLLNDIEKLSWHQEEPYGSASIYAQYCVMRLAKEHQVTVLLDGQGADEILAGGAQLVLQVGPELAHLGLGRHQLLLLRRLARQQGVDEQVTGLRAEVAASQVERHLDGDVGAGDHGGFAAELEAGQGVGGLLGQQERDRERQRGEERHGAGGGTIADGRGGAFLGNRFPSPPRVATAARPAATCRKAGLPSRMASGNRTMASAQAPAVSHANAADGSWWAGRPRPWPACRRSASGCRRWPMPRIKEPNPPSSRATP